MDSLARAETTLVMVAGEESDIDAIKYCAPEILFGDSQDTRSDIFAFGVLAYELLFSCGKKDTFLQTMQGLHLEQKNSSELEIDPKNCIFGEVKGEDIAKEIRSSLDYNPAFRPKKIGEFAVRLIGACGSLGEEAADRVNSISAKPASELQRLKPRPPVNKSGKWLVLFGILSVALIIAAVSLTYWEINQDSASPVRRNFKPELQSAAAEMLTDIQEGDQELVAEVDKLRARVSELFKSRGAVELRADEKAAQDFLQLQTEAEVRAEHLATYRRWISGDRSGLPMFETRVRRKRITPANHASLVNRLDAIDLLNELYEKKLALIVVRNSLPRESSGEKRKAIDTLLRKVDENISAGKFYTAVQAVDAASGELLTPDGGASGSEESSSYAGFSGQSQPNPSLSSIESKESKLSHALASVKRLQDSRKHSQAIQFLEPFLLQDDLSESEKSSLYYSLGRSYYKKRKFLKAEEILQRAIDIDSKQADYHFALGNVYLYSKRYGKAIECFELALEIAPDTVSYLSNLGIALKRDGQSGRAKEMLNRAIVLDPESPVARNALSDINGFSDEAKK
jgi:tetratricopeptide (TPR) repeat protein